MITTDHIVIAVLIGFIGYVLARWGTLLYYDYQKKKSGERFVTWERFRRPVIFVAIISLPLLFINLTRPDREFLTAQESVERAWEDRDFDQIQYKTKRLLEEDSTNINSHFFFILAHTKLKDRMTLDEVESFYQPYIESKDQYIKDIGYLMMSLGGAWDPFSRDVTPWLRKVSDQDSKYVQFAYGTYHYELSHYDKAEPFFQREIENDGFVQGATESLHSIYEYTNNREALHDLYYNEKAFPFLPWNQRRETYYKDGSWTWYFRTAFQRQEESFNIFGLIAALFVTLVWAVYIRSTDIFEPEPWWAVIVVFMVGAVLTYLVYPLSDYLEFNFDFTLTGDAWNDWWYCLIGIGMVEELAKMIPWLFFVFVIRKTREPFDYIVYASIAALGFAFTENLLYYEYSRLSIIDMRGLMAAIAHMFFASTVAYSFILMKYRYSDKKWSGLLPVAGFILAAAGHGFYDFWLISPEVRVMWFVTYAFFMFSLHLWTTMKNNALNNSTFFDPAVKPVLDKVNFRLILSMVAIFMIEYTLVGVAYGKEPANNRILEGSLMTGLLIAYISSTFSGMELKKGVWNRFKSPLEWFSLPSFTGADDEGPSSKSSGTGAKRYLTDMTGNEFRFYAPKSNPYVGNRLPVSGSCTKRMKIGGDSNWYLVRLYQTVDFPGMVNDKVLIRHKTDGKDLSTDKVEIYFMMMPNEQVLNEDEIEMTQLRYMGRVYSRPIDRYGNTIN